MIRRFFSVRLAVLASSLAAAVTSAQAALPASVDTAISGSGTDTLAALGLMIGVVVAIWGMKKVMGLFGK